MYVYHFFNSSGLKDFVKIYNEMGCKVACVLLFVVCILSVELHASPEKYFKRCETKCCSRRNKCTIESRKGDISDIPRRLKVLNDLIDCRRRFEACENDCLCKFSCASERLHCREFCDLSNDLSRKEKRQCKRRCYNDMKKCRNTC